MKIPRLLFHIIGILADNLFPVSALCAIYSAAACKLSIVLTYLMPCRPLRDNNIDGFATDFAGHPPPQPATPSNNSRHTRVCDKFDQPATHSLSHYIPQGVIMF